MPKKYGQLLSPIKIGNVVLKNRLIAARSSPGYIQGDEKYPTEALITHYAEKARNGAAVVTCGGVGMPHFIPDRDAENFTSKTILPGTFDIEDETCRRYLSQLTDAIHFYGGKASMQIGGYVPLKYDVSPDSPSISVGPIFTPRTGEEIPEAELEKVADDYVHQARIMKAVGFDMVYLHMAYRLTIFGRFLSPLTNKRTDKFGGNHENRARFPLMVADRIKQACGKDFLIEASISGCEPAGGMTIEDTIAYAKLFTGHIDLLQVRTHDIDPAHPVGFTKDPTPFLHMAEKVKKSGVGIAVVTVGGNQDLDVNEEIIASGKADLIAMARGLISNPEYGRLAYEGRGEDVVPCIRCNFCMRSSLEDPIVSVCSVNPIWGLEHKIQRMVQPPGKAKKLAVVGGGPAGMKAALVAADRGHSVTLYEKSDSLGGILKTTNHVSFKWPLRNYMNFLIRQIEKRPVQVRLNVEADEALLLAESFDAIIVSIGSEPIMPDIPGMDGDQVVSAVNVYGHEDTLGKNVVIVGGGEVGVETGMHLAEKGHRVTLLEMGNMLAPLAPPIHFYSLLKEAWENQEGFDYILQALCRRIEPGKVIYTDVDEIEHEVRADSVVNAVGMKPLSEPALKLCNCAERFYMIGDCNGIGNVQKATRSAFSTVSLI